MIYVHHVKICNECRKSAPSQEALFWSACALFTSIKQGKDMGFDENGPILQPSVKALADVMFCFDDEHMKRFRDFTMKIGFDFAFGCKHHAPPMPVQPMPEGIQ